MLIWINGPFGSGKTQTAHELHRRIPGSVVSDPELLAIAMQKTLPGLETDYQAYKLWRDIVRGALTQADSSYKHPVIVPMTIVNIGYFNEIIGGLRSDGIDIRHFTLLAPKEELLRRLRERLDFANSWPAQQLDRCLDALHQPQFAEHIDTRRMSVVQVADDIAGRCGLDLEPPTRSRMRQLRQRLAVQIRHIRL